MMTKEELRTICDVVGGARVVADYVPSTVRAVHQWLAGKRKISRPVEARIRELHRQRTEVA